MDEQKPKSREEILAAIKAKADAIRAQRTTAPKPAQPGTAQPGPPGATLETFVSAINAAGRPAAAPQSAKVRAYASVNSGVEIQSAASEAENLRRLLGGIGAYENPVRAGAFQIDYRYYAEAKTRLERAGYQIEEDEFGPLDLSKWNPVRAGWSKTEDEPKA